MHAEIGNDERVIIETEPLSQSPSTLLDYLRRIDLIKFSVAMTVLVLLIAITISLIINPKSLNSENNLSVGLLLGAIIGKFTTLVDYYYTNKNGHSS